MKNRICFYVFGYPPDFSGATNQAIKVSKELLTKSLANIFVTYTYNKDNLLLNESVPGLHRFLRSEKGMILYHVKALWYLFNLRDKYDVIYLNGNDGQYWTAFYFTILGKCLGKKIFMELNMEYPDPLCIAGTRFELMKNIVSRYVDQYICLSTIIKDRMEECHPNLRSTILFNGVDLNRFRPVATLEYKRKIRQNLGIDENDKVVVTCGAICKRKGIDFLLNVWKSVVMENKNARLYLLGPLELDGYDGGFSNEMLQESKSESFQNSVNFTGCVDNVEEYLQAADLFIFAGRQEGSPNVIREAMASGLPVVSLQLKGITDDMIIDGFNGYIVEVVDQQALSDYANTNITDHKIHSSFVECVSKLLSDIELANMLGKNGRQMAKEKFSIKMQVDNLLQLIAKSN